MFGPFALGVAHLHANARRVDIADLQRQPLTQTQAQTVEGQGERMIGEYQPGELIPRQPVTERVQERSGGQVEVKKLLELPDAEPEEPPVSESL